MDGKQQGTQISQAALRTENKLPPLPSLTVVEGTSTAKVSPWLSGGPGLTTRESSAHVHRVSLPSLSLFPHELAFCSSQDSSPRRGDPVKGF